MGFQYNQTAEQGNFSAVITGIKGDAVISGLSVGESSPAAMSVLVAAGNCTVAGIVFEEGSGQNVSVTAADAVNPRKDIITYDPTTTNPICTAGTPAAIPVPPDIPSGDILLSIIYVAANVVTIVNADIEDGRVFVDNGLPIRSVSVSDTALDADTVIAVDASGGARTITLPTAVGIQGKIYVIKKTDSSSNDVTIDGDGAETIDGATTYILNGQYKSVIIQSNNTNWYILSGEKLDCCFGITPTNNGGWSGIGQASVATLGNITDEDRTTFTTGGTQNANDTTTHDITTIDLGSLKTINEICWVIKMYNETTGYGVNAYVQYSADNATYYTGSTVTKPGSGVTATYADSFIVPIQIRYIRVDLVAIGAFAYGRAVTIGDIWTQ